MLSRPEHIREVFAGPADIFHAGEGNAILGPIMGEHSRAAARRGRAPRRAQARDVGLPRRGDARWGTVVEQLAADTVASWPVGITVRRAPAHERHQPRGDPAHRLRRHRRGAAGRDAPAAAAARADRADRSSSAGSTRGSTTSARGGGSTQLKAKTDALLYAEIAERRAVTDLGRTHGRAVEAARRRPEPDRRGTARSPRHAAARRARDDRVDAGLDVPRPGAAAASCWRGCSAPPTRTTMTTSRPSSRSRCGCDR